MGELLRPDGSGSVNGVARLALALLALLCWPQAAQTAMDVDKAEVTIVTSYPPSFFEPFQEAFSKQQPDIRLTIVQRNTASAVRFIRDKKDMSADMFWASAPDSFELLKQQKLLRKTHPRPTGSPDDVSGYPVNDPDGYYLGFALSGYGFVYSPAYLAENKLPIPRTWSDLTLPIYSGHVGISAPSRSGTTHLIVEAILQTYGWDAGWALLSRLGGNLSTVTARSFGVASGVAQQRFGVGITIDFLGTPPNFPAGSTEFVLPPDTVFAPASIAILSRSNDAEAAELFIDFLLSEDGQKILLRPEINRIPVFSTLVPEMRKDVVSQSTDGGLLKDRKFDAALSARRYQFVNLVFDEYIIRKRATLARLWKQVAALSTVKDPGSGLTAVLNRATEFLGRAPLPYDGTVGATNLADLADVPTGLPLPPGQAELVDQLRASIERQLQSAEQILSEAARDYLRQEPERRHQ